MATLSIWVGTVTSRPVESVNTRVSAAVFSSPAGVLGWLPQPARLRVITSARTSASSF